MPRHILHVDLDAFFVAVEQARDPTLRGRPVVVGGEPGGRGVVACASYEARAYGLYAGMPLAKARRLCPGALFLRGHFPRYQEASERFMALLADLTPQVEPLGLDEAYLDLTGFEPLYGPVRETVQRLKARIQSELGLTASVGIASCKVVAKVASDLSKPDGLLEVQPSQERAFLAPLPLGRLPGIGPRMEEKLKGLGISTVGQLSALSLPLVRDLLGTWGEVLHRQAQGSDERKVLPPAPAQSISRSTTLPEDTLDCRFLRAVLRYLAERTGAQLRKEGKQARCVTLKLRYSDFETITRRRTLKEAVEGDDELFQVGQGLLEQALGQRRKLVRLVGIGVSGLATGRQLGLWGPPSERKQRLTRAIDSLRHRYGFTSIQTGYTFSLREVFETERGNYLLATPSLSR